MKEKIKKEIEKLSFEQALNELEIIAEKLEQNQLTLQESIDSYEKATFLRSHCENFLKKAEGKIEVLANKNGKIVKENFQNNEEEESKSHQIDDDIFL